MRRFSPRWSLKPWPKCVMSRTQRFGGADDNGALLDDGSGCTRFSSKATSRGQFSRNDRRYVCLAATRNVDDTSRSPESVEKSKSGFLIGTRDLTCDDRPAGVRCLVSVFPVRELLRGTPAIPHIETMFYFIQPVSYRGCAISPRVAPAF